MSVALNRRRFLALGGGAAAVLAGGTAALARFGQGGPTGAVVPSKARLPQPFSATLSIPPVVSPTNSVGSGSDAVELYRITQRPATVRILPEVDTEIWGYNGIFPGPTFETRTGQAIEVEHRNELGVPTVVHLHGGRTPADSDGYPTDLVLPAAGWPGSGSAAGADGGHGTVMHDPRAVVTRTVRRYRYPLQQRATMLWYHDHRMDFTGPAIYRGLAGLHLVRDDTEQALDLPGGDAELPLMISDRSFNEDGSFAYPALDPSASSRPGVAPRYAAGVLGDVILVNGTPWPTAEVTGRRYRLRLLNASNARRYLLALRADGYRDAPLVQIGADHGLLAKPVQHNALPIGPAERFDVLVDFSQYRPGTTVTMVNLLDTGPVGVVMRFVVTRRQRDESRPIQALPDPLSEIETLHRGQAARVRDFAFSAKRMSHGTGWVIGGKPFDPSDDATVTGLGEVEIWRFIADVHHPIHLHLTNFQVLTRNGVAPEPHDAGLKDTVDLRPGESVEVIARFDGYRGRYLFHCHNAEHEDMAMMANLIVD